jgi:hypothetical protein
MDVITKAIRASRGCTLSSVQLRVDTWGISGGKVVPYKIRRLVMMG